MPELRSRPEASPMSPLQGLGRGPSPWTLPHPHSNAGADRPVRGPAHDKGRRRSMDDAGNGERHDAHLGPSARRGTGRAPLDRDAVTLDVEFQTGPRTKACDAYLEKSSLSSRQGAPRPRPRWPR